MQQQQSFEQSPEAQEYITKLQTGRQELPTEAEAMEHKVLDLLLGLGRRLRETSTRQGDLEKQIAVLEAQRKQLGVDLDLLSGEMSGYAKLLVSAEAARREPTAELAPPVKTPVAPELVEAQA